jgi:hypothetical protein
VAHPVDAAAADVNAVLAVVSHDSPRRKGRTIRPQRHSLGYGVEHPLPTCQVKYFSVPYRGTLPPCGTASGGGHRRGRAPSRAGTTEGG